MRVQVKSRNTITKAEFVLFEDNVATSSLEVEVDLADSGYVADVPACEGRCEFVLLGYGVDGDLVETGQAYFSLEGVWVFLLSLSLSLTSPCSKTMFPPLSITWKSVERRGGNSSVNSPQIWTRTSSRWAGKPR